MWKGLKEKLKGKPEGVYMKVDGILFDDDPRYAVLKSRMDELLKENVYLKSALQEAEYENARLQQTIKEGGSK
jgi:hypothetical protein